ncbi:MAG: DUF2190 family protein [Patescibacteria group bacterium]|nr:DUF2190 family protein [Patescibacteria group bacterium]
MADEHDLLVETEVPINFLKATGDAFEQGQILKMTNPMTAALAAGDGDICAGVVHTEVTAAEASASVSIYRGGIFRATAGVAGVTLGEAIQMDAATSPANRLVDADVNSEQIVGICLETASTGVRFVYELKPRAVDLA